MLKGMLEQQTERDTHTNLEGTVYGNKKDLNKILSLNVRFRQVKGIYGVLLKEKIGSEGNLIPSRSEKKNPLVDWETAWKNWKGLRCVTPEIKCFAWKLLQDMLEIPSRRHRGGQSKDCNTLVYDEQLNEMICCGNLGDIKHMFAKWQSVEL